MPTMTATVPPAIPHVTTGSLPRAGGDQDPRPHVDQRKELQRPLDAEQVDQGEPAEGGTQDRADGVIRRYLPDRLSGRPPAIGAGSFRPAETRPP